MTWLTLVEMVRRLLMDFIFTWHGCRTQSWYVCTIIFFPELVLRNVGCWRTPSSRWSANQMLGTKKKGVGLPLGPAQLNPLRSWCQSQWLGNQKMCGFFLQLSSSYRPAIAALVMISPIWTQRWQRAVFSKEYHHGHHANVREMRFGVGFETFCCGGKIG